MHKRSIRIAQHNTSISLEPEFWVELKRIAAKEKISLNQLVARVDETRTGNLSSALRVFVLHNRDGSKLELRHV
jgi:predicted DNA-binding ribbon-helix-helix protein